MPLDPQARAALGHMREAGRRCFQHLTVQEARQPAWAFVDLQGSPVPAGSGQSVRRRDRDGILWATSASGQSTPCMVKEQDYEHDT
jgi:hypothetical protein